MMVNDEPMVALFHEREAIACWQGLRLAILDVRERVVAGVNGRISVHTDQLVTKRHLQLW